MNPGNVFLVVGCGLIGLTAGQFIGWWAIPLTFGLAFYGSAIALEVIEATRLMRR